MSEAGTKETTGRDTYNHADIERKWQAAWESLGVSRADQGGQSGRQTYILEMFPYPSGNMHMGHVKNYTMGDVVTLYRRRLGDSVMHPMGYDSFGLPAENAAIKEGGHPRDVTARNIASIEEDFHRMGWSIDWSRRLATHTPEYYRHTQAIFLELFNRDLCYRKDGLVNWCPVDQTVLANEQVEADGTCERCGSEVEKKSLEQWYMKTTDYAERLLDDLDKLENWPERVVTMQRNWIGKSHGATIAFRCEELDLDIPVFTTRPDTLCGATFFVLSPEHPLVPVMVGGTQYAERVMDYVNASQKKSHIERTDATRDKTGVATGRFVTNPINGVRIPVLVADYVLPDYGTGALMAVPAHDERDHEFAEKFDIPIKQVITDNDSGISLRNFDKPTTGEELPLTLTDGKLINSMQFSGLSVAEGGKKIVAWLEKEGKGESSITYRLRDWLISRQRYWGCPIPIINCDSCGMVPVPTQDLPVELPDVTEYAPKGTSPLATATEWVNTSCPSCGGEATRETDTMDTFMDSSWYFLRFADTDNTDKPFSKELVDKWLPVDEYIGGIEHAVGHLMYARFITKALKDAGWHSVDEPFDHLFTQGMIYYQGAKMSKSKGNVVEPLPYVEQYGADALRLFILFLGPPDQDAEWQDTGIEGTRRFLDRLYRAAYRVERSWRDAGNEAGPMDSPPVDAIGDDSDAQAMMRDAHAAMGRVTDAIENGFRFNTAIAQLMETLNTVSRVVNREGEPPSQAALAAARFACQTIVQLLQPFAPHIACELWENMGADELWVSEWPVADEAWLTEDTVTIVVQVNGKLRDRIEVAADADEETVIAAAQASEKVQGFTEGTQIRKTIHVPGKLVNIVAN